MKPNFSVKLFFALLTFSIGSFMFASFAFNRATTTNPEILDQVAKHFNVDISKGFYIDFDSSAQFEHIEKAWEFDNLQKEIEITTRSAVVKVEKSMDGKLHIKASGEYNKNKSSEIFQITVEPEEISISDEYTQNRNTTLIVQLPTPFHEVKIKTISGDISLNDIGGDKVEVVSTSGNVQVRNVSIKDFESKNTSGSLQFENTVPADIEARSISGNVQIKGVDLEKSEQEIRSVSGKIVNSYKGVRKSPYELKVSTVSGDIEIR